MPKYRNKKTGVTVEINAVMRGKNWEEVKKAVTDSWKSERD